VELLRTRDDLRGLEALRAEGPLVLVPTMGALHAGHLSLVEEAARHGRVVVSIFVNPTQFGPGEDFASYPRDLKRDLELLEPLAPAAIFTPDVATMYPREKGVSVVPGPRADVLCGLRRPGHFTGVLTVVLKLFNLVRPDVAVFGRKDAQQCLVIAGMVDDLAVPVRLIDAPTLREPDGLAMSSRNRYLDPDARRRAVVLSRALRAGREALAEGVDSADEIEDRMTLQLADADVVDYARILAVPDLERRAPGTGRWLLAVAAHVGTARLIDNLVLDVGPQGVVEAPLLEEIRT
jgi:pantoate--beta-alanine ligase